jgi:hypothetical protein
MTPLRLALALGLLLPLSAPAAGLRAGAARVDITPPIGHPLWGYGGRHQPSTGVLDRLHARALVLETGGKRLALVALDLGRPPTRASSAAIRGRVQKDGKIDALFLVASHTHHGPVLEIETWPTAKTSYVRSLEQKLGDVVLAAVKDLRTAKLGVASKDSARNRNRHWKRADPPLDRSLLLLRVEDAGGKVIAHAVNFAAHPTMRPAKQVQLSADYPGALCTVVEKEAGGLCLFLQGAAGDLSTRPGKAEVGPEKFGQALGREALALAKGIRCADLDKATCEVRDEDLAFRGRTQLDNPFWRTRLIAAFSAGVVAFYEREYKTGVRPRLTTALVDGRIGFVGVSGEFFCGHALHLRRRARLEHLFFLGYCNDYQQYFPTIEAAAEGGYGTQWYVSPATIGSGERIMDRALLRLNQMRGKLKDVQAEPDR